MTQMKHAVHARQTADAHNTNTARTMPAIPYNVETTSAVKEKHVTKIAVVTGKKPIYIRGMIAEDVEIAAI